MGRCKHDKKKIYTTPIASMIILLNITLKKKEKKKYRVQLLSVNLYTQSNNQQVISTHSGKNHLTLNTINNATTPMLPQIFSLGKITVAQGTIKTENYLAF